jgi:four helix bundle protein
MGAQTFRDLIVWRLSSALRDELLQITRRRSWDSDRRFRDHLRECAGAVPSNIAEGFGRFSHPQFAQYLNVARGSLAETMTRVDEAVARELITKEEALRLEELSVRASRALVSLLRYLQRNSTPTAE